MQSIQIALLKALAMFADVPLAYRTEEEQRITMEAITASLQHLANRLATQGLTASRIGQSVSGAQRAAEASPTNENELALNLQALFNALNDERPASDYEDLIQVLGTVLERTQPFTQSEQAAVTAREQLSADEVGRHDHDILEKQMQLYGLDYFLEFHKRMKAASLDQQQVLVLRGEHELDLPALREDALNDDMLKKVVYELYGRDLRARMIRDYYRYKLAFANLAPDHMSEVELTAIQAALRTYCETLIDVSLEEGVTTLSSSLFQPYGKDVPLISVREQL